MFFLLNTNLSNVKLCATKPLVTSPISHMNLIPLGMWSVFGLKDCIQQNLLQAEINDHGSFFFFPLPFAPVIIIEQTACATPVGSLTEIKQHGDNGMDYLGITAAGKGERITLKDGHRIQVWEESQQMALSSVETKSS